MAKKKLPKRIYIKWEINGDERYLVAEAKPEYLSEENATIDVGEYELKATRRLINRTTIG